MLSIRILGKSYNLCDWNSFGIIRFVYSKEYRKLTLRLNFTWGLAKRARVA